MIPEPPTGQLRAIFETNEAVREMLGSRSEGRDYWLSINRIANAWHGDEGAYIEVILRAPVSFEGTVPSMSEPCQGKIPDGGAEELDDPCVDEPRDYFTIQTKFTNAPMLYVQVDTGQNAVVRIMPNYTTDAAVRDLIQDASTHYPPVP